MKNWNSSPTLIALATGAVTFAGMTLFAPFFVFLIYGEVLIPPPFILPIFRFAIPPLLATAVAIVQYRACIHHR